VNWCPELGTVLANEEVIDGKSEVGGFPVIRKPMRQWMLRITAYAEKLLADLEIIDWSDSLKEMQRNWIGRSEGAEVDFKLPGPSAEKIRVFTTRPDTLFGATYMVLIAGTQTWCLKSPRPEQAEAVKAIKLLPPANPIWNAPNWPRKKPAFSPGLMPSIPSTAKRSPSGLRTTCSPATAPAPSWRCPRMTRATLNSPRNSICPSSRSFSQTIPAGKEWQGFTDDGIAVNSGFITGLTTAEAKKKITAWLEEKGSARRTINFKLRDWLFSRQRYWGEPFPIIWKRDAAGNLYHEALPESALPLLPPTLEDYKPTADGQPPLARAKDWVTLPDGSIRETNTMPQWAGSCWYYLRYTDAKNAAPSWARKRTNTWMASNGKSAGVDLYVGGTEHAVLHLLYARFWHKVLFDLGHVSTPEPFYKLVNQGLILRFARENGELVSAARLRDIAEEALPAGPALVGVHKETGEKIFGQRIGAEAVEVKPQGIVLRSDPQIVVDGRCSKMSKSRGNVVNPDAILEEYGADAFRLYEMFMGPLQDSKPWNTNNVEGVYRFLGRVWRLFVDEKSATAFEQAETTATDACNPELLDTILLDGAITDISPTSVQLKNVAPLHQESH
jgi:leucyl-tRNA synthetase